MPDISVYLSPELHTILSPVVNFAILVVVGYLGVRSTNRIALDLIEEADRKTNFKTFMSNLLTQAGVVSALLLSIEIPMVQLDVPVGFARNTLLWDVYYGTCFLSTGFSVQGVCCSVLVLAYIQGLDNKECFHFLAHSPDSIGFAVGSMAIAAYLLIIQTTLFFIITASSYWMIIYIGIAGGICLFNITTSWKNFSRFKSGIVTPEERSARRDVFGLGKSRGWADWFKAGMSDGPHATVKPDQVGFTFNGGDQEEHRD